MRNRLRELTGSIRRHPTVTDGVVSVVLAVAALASYSTTLEVVRQDPKAAYPFDPWVVASLLAVTLPLTFRRRYPLAVAGFVVASLVAGRVLLAPGFPFLPAWEQYVTVWSSWLALYTAVALGTLSKRAVAWITAILVVLVAEVVREDYFSDAALRGFPRNQAFQVVYAAVFLIWPVLLGVVVRSLRVRERELAAQATELRREREANARRAVLEERVRIARELHDVVAHHVSVMGVQAGAARRVMGTQPARAEEALGSIEESSRQAVVELHRILGFLRRSDQVDELAPQPSLAQVDTLVRNAEDGGLKVELSVEGHRRPLTPSLEVSAYRVIQEALTNAVKHSGGTTARVRLAYETDALQIEVQDDGRDGGRHTEGAGGHGLIGMRERLTLHGGHLRAGDAPNGGFEVHATFPLEGAPS